jgi:hypothetical protein
MQIVGISIFSEIAAGDMPHVTGGCAEFVSRAQENVPTLEMDEEIEMGGSSS